MLGFVWGLTSELGQHKSIWLQLTEPQETGLFWTVVSVNLVILASLAPLLKGKAPEDYK